MSFNGDHMSKDLKHTGWGHLEVEHQKDVCADTTRRSCMEGAFETSTGVPAGQDKAHCIRARKCDTQIYLPMFMACVNANRLLKGLRLRSRGGEG